MLEFTVKLTTKLSQFWRKVILVLMITVIPAQEIEDWGRLLLWPVQYRGLPGWTGTAVVATDEVDRDPPCPQRHSLDCHPLQTTPDSPALASACPSCQEMVHIEKSNVITFFNTPVQWLIFVYNLHFFSLTLFCKQN